MIKTIGIAGLITAFLTTAAFAAGPSKEEGAGLGLGAIIGAAAGGPPGAIIGAAFGARMGQTLHQKNNELETLTASLDASRTRIESLQANVSALNGKIRDQNGELQEIRDIAKPELLTLLATGIEMDLLFRTDDDTLTATISKKIDQLAASLIANPDIRIRLDGYADERGDASYNQELSARRVGYVRNLLIDNGIPADRITADAHGESLAAEKDVDGFALERRVSLRIYLNDAPSMAANPR